MPLSVTLTRTVSSSKVINASRDAILEVLHDPPTLIKLSPLVTGVTVSPTDPDFYTITDKFVFLGFMSTSMNYTAKFTRTEDGITSLVNAGAGTELLNNWRVHSVEGGGYVVTEEVTVKVRLQAIPAARL